MNNEEWTPEELERLRAARTDAVPPRDLEEATVAALRHRGLVARRLSHGRVAFALRQKAVVATALFAVAAAIVAAATWSVMHKGAAPAAPSPRFVLLLYAGADPVAGTPDTRRQEYAQWARDLASRGTAISGEELAEEALEVGSGARPAGDLPRGFFVVGAADLAAAERLAATCPHLRYGGRIVVKRIVG